MNSVARSAPCLFAIYLAGTLCLPISSFERYRDLPDPSIEVLGNALAFENPINRGLVLGLLALLVAACILGWNWARGDRSLHWSLCDVAFGLWIATPVLCGVFNPSPFLADVRQSLYLGVVWGGPYWLGRSACRTRDDLRGMLGVLVVAGGISLLPALAEFATGRFVYSMLYGYQPFQNVGEVRYFGYRPLLCFEDPNQVAMWWLTVAMAAWVITPKRSNNPWTWVLLGTTLALPFLFQGIGASVLTLVGVAALSVRWPPTVLLTSVRWRLWAGAAIGISAVLFLARGPLLGSVRSMLQRSGMEPAVKDLMRAVSLDSFSWRLAREVDGNTAWNQHPVFGWGTVTFWKDAGMNERPWGLFSMVTGTYGWVGVLICLTAFIASIACIWTGELGLENERSSDGSGAILTRWQPRLSYGVACLATLHVIDAALNPALFLPILILIGAGVSVRKPCAPV